MKNRCAAISAATLAGLMLAACSSGSSTARMAAAADEDTCGWDGTAAAVIAVADTAMAGEDFSSQITDEFGEAAKAGEARISEIMFGVEAGTVQPPTDAMSLSNIDAIYNIPVFPDGDSTKDDTAFASVHIIMTGACVGFFEFVPQMWLETYGVDAPTLETQQALEKGISYLKEKSDETTAASAIVHDMLLYKRVKAPTLLLTWYMRGHSGSEPFILQIDQDGTVTPW